MKKINKVKINLNGKKRLISSKMSLKSLLNNPKYLEQMGQKGREHVLKNYNFENFNNSWVNVMTKVNKEHGSWKNRKSQSRIRFKEVA